MAVFNPAPGQKLKISGERYRVCADPQNGDRAYRVIGSGSSVYQLEAIPRLLEGQRGHYALKVLPFQQRQPGQRAVAESIAQFADGRATQAFKQECITREQNLELIHSYSELEFALLRPWLEGATWAEIVAARTTYDDTYDYTRESGIALAKHLGRTLARLEARYAAHCDLSSANIIITSRTTLALIDVERMYMVGLPPQQVAGSAGYAFRRGPRPELWSAKGDRFAAALLFTELLGWADKQVREASFGSSFFEQAELHNPFSPRYTLMHHALNRLRPGIAMLFAQAWRAQSLADCPSLSDWYQELRMHK